MSDTEKFHHSVYVILLDPAALRHRSIMHLNPNRHPAKPCVYVGMTGLPVEDRFENHKHGYKSSWVVEKYGVRLLPELYAHLNPMPFEAAVQMEMELAEDLRLGLHSHGRNDPARLAELWASLSGLRPVIERNWPRQGGQCFFSIDRVRYG